MVMRKFRTWVGTLILGFAIRILAKGRLKTLLGELIYDNINKIKDAWNQDMYKK